jgi:UV DNA damage endonuclease
LSIKRFEENFYRLSQSARDRLVIENCEMSYCIEDLLPTSERLKIPIVIDTHHDNIHGSSKSAENYFDRVFKIWKERGIKPKIHVSNSVPGILDTDTKTARRKHSDYISFFHECLQFIDFPIDVMLECKMKEMAILKLRLGKN